MSLPEDFPLLIPQGVPNGGKGDALGAVIVADGVNFAVYSESAALIEVVLFDEQDRQTARFPLDGRDGAIHHGLVAGIGQGTKYGLRAEGRYDPEQGYWFDPSKLLVDPYAKRLDRPFVRDSRLALPRQAVFDTAPLVPKAIVMGVGNKPSKPRQKAPGLTYELNVRGYTMQHPDVPQRLRGTLDGLTTPQVLEHLLKIGVDTIELMPVCAFIDEGHLPPLGLHNAWGYNPLTYFALDPRLAPGGMQEMRAFADLYRKNGISVILDVVYNHTGETDINGPTLSMRGLDNLSYYRHVDIDGRKVLVNDAGTGNVLACDHPAVQRLVLDSLRFWIEEGGVSGFRFDLAPMLGREPGFNPNAALLQAIKADPVISKSMLIAEPWDPGPGGYQLGQFGKEFREWNDTYRDDVRSFWRGDDARVGSLAGKVSGSSEIFNFDGRRPSSGVNFLAVHDGFTLLDTVSYAEKHNEANGENNRDGHGQNHSWNCGHEGATNDPRLTAARQRDVRALLATLLVSRGTPLTQQGDEMGRTQGGNNNAYAQDNPITWVDWPNADTGLIDFFARMAAFRRDHSALKHDHFLTGLDRTGPRDVAWLHPDGREMTEGDWNYAGASVLGMWLKTVEDEVLVWFNRKIDPVTAVLPDEDWAVGIVSDERAELVVGGGYATLPARSVLVLVRG